MSDRFTVLRNPAGAYGLHPAEQEIPGGWQAVGYTGSEDECVRFVDERENKELAR